MDVVGNTVVVEALATVTLGLLVFILGDILTRHVRVLRDFNIPEPVSGGLLIACVTMLIYAVFGIETVFDLSTRDYFLVLFFSTIGLNARLSDLFRGGRPLVILLGLTIGFIFVQNVIGQLGVLVFGLPGALSVFLGSASLIGGHGTVVAWTPSVSAASGSGGAAELGVAMATLGLVLAALVGGPIAKYLIERDGLEPDDPDAAEIVGLPYDEELSVKITHVTLMQVLLTLHFAILLGYVLDETLEGMGLDLPLFVSCMLMAIVVGNIRKMLLRERDTVQHSPTLAIVSEFALGIFLSMSLMSLQLWALAGFGVTLLVVLGAQVAATLAWCLFVVYRVMGRNYFASVLSAGFAGFGLGATPTAIANMTAVTKRYGPAPLAFIVLPLISAFFVDIANAVLIQWFITF
ncbi:MAG: sodium/glutamate symporter [Pseudomonadota bacterium]